jgi:hypothetical protein
VGENVLYLCGEVRQGGFSFIWPLVDSLPGLCLDCCSRFSWVHMHGGPGARSSQAIGLACRASSTMAHLCFKTPEIVLSGGGGGVALMLSARKNSCDCVWLSSVGLLETAISRHVSSAKLSWSPLVSVKTERPVVREERSMSMSTAVSANGRSGSKLAGCVQRNLVDQRCRTQNRG